VVEALEATFDSSNGEIATSCKLAAGESVVEYFAQRGFYTVNIKKAPK
jgi:hypothetical protein